MDKNFVNDILTRYKLAVRRKEALQRELNNLEIEVQHLEPLAKLYGSENYFDTIEEERRVTENMLKGINNLKEELKNVDIVPDDVAESFYNGRGGRARKGTTKYDDIFGAIWSGDSKNEWKTMASINTEFKKLGIELEYKTLNKALNDSVRDNKMDKKTDYGIRFKWKGRD